MSYPDSINMRALDRAMGSNRDADRQVELATVRAAVAKMQDVANVLRTIEGLGWWVDDACHTAGDAVEAQVELIGVMLP